MALENRANIQMAKRNVLEKRDREIIDRYKSLLTEEGVSFDKIYLFGSKALGKSHRWSDLDLCVVSNDFGKNYHKELVRLNLLANRVDPAIEAFPMKAEDLEDRFDSFAGEIARTGVLV